ncbi:MAG: kinase/pyrophosphorylase [Xanthomonadales bacterium]|nr:kinase/pyrophosphorylase [Xanthomonadales bacterium]
MSIRRTVFFVSDGTAITAGTLGNTLLTQFEGQKFNPTRIPFVDSVERAHDVVTQINEAAERDGAMPLIFSTIVDAAVVAVLQESQGEVLDLFTEFVPRIEKVVGAARSPKVGRAHGISNVSNYENRIEATNYALSHDDGVSINFDEAEVILVGVSRSGKTPTCLYLALHFGVLAANYPLTDDDLESIRLPAFLRRNKHKLYGLTIDAERLSQIRETRRPGSRYASMSKCRNEIGAAEDLLRAEGVPIVSTTHSSVEEIASRILVDLGLERQHY